MTISNQNRFSGALRVVSAAFAIAGGGCVHMQSLNTSNCIETDQTQTNFIVFSHSSRHDHYSRECDDARAQTVIAGMTNSDGSPNVRAEAAAIEYYKRAKPEVRRIMDQMRKDHKQSTFPELDFELKQARADAQVGECKRVAGTNPVTGKPDAGWRCTDRNLQMIAPVTPAPAALSPSQHR